MKYYLEQNFKNYKITILGIKLSFFQMVCFLNNVIIQPFFNCVYK